MGNVITPGDLETTGDLTGVIFKDRITGDRYRIYFSGGSTVWELV